MAALDYGVISLINGKLDGGRKKNNGTACEFE